MNQLPRLSHSFFKWYCRYDRYEELHGDLEEIFHERVERLGARKARFMYTLDVIRCCQPYAWRKPDFAKANNLVMYRSYSKISWRVLMKNPLSSFINVFGLAVAIGFCVLGYAYTKWVYGTDSFHENKHEVFQVTYMSNMNGTLEQHGTTSAAIGELLREDLPGVSVCQIDDRSVVVKHEKDVFHERMRFVDPAFLDMFTFPLKWGSPGSLSDSHSIILSEPTSIKYFGDANPVGTSVEIVFGENNKKTFTVTGVAVKFPDARSFEFDFLVNRQNLKTAIVGYKEDDWKSLHSATFIRITDHSKVTQIEKGLQKYEKIQNAAQSDWIVSSFKLEPLATLYRNSNDMRNSFARRGFNDNEKSVYFLFWVALGMLTLACLNYVNIAIVSAAKRLKEIGVRKSIGATNARVVNQFLLENIFQTLFALVFGIALGAFIIVPWFETINAFKTGFTFMDRSLWLFLAGVLLLTGFASGIYPAFFISRFSTVSIFKGTLQLGKQNPLIKIFLGIQLVLACITITFGIMFTKNSYYLAERPWGYQQKGVLFANIPNESAFEQLDKVLRSHPAILSVAGSREHIGKTHNNTVIELAGRKYEVNEIAVGEGYLETMGVELKTGRFLHDTDGADRHSVVINETMARNLEWSNPVGMDFKIDSIQYSVVGVVKDFHHSNFSRAVAPTIITAAKRSDFHFVAAKTIRGKEEAALELMHREWTKLFSDVPFQGGYQGDVWGRYFQFINNHGQVWQFIAIAAVVLATLGLYGLVVLNVSGRIKEFSIRKVLGAGLANLGTLLFKQYSLLFGVSLLIGAPLSYFMIKAIFDMAYKYHMPVTFNGTIIAVTLLILVLLMVVLSQVTRLAKQSPVEGLKTE